MYNQQIADELLKKYGKEAVVMYCKMESYKNEMLAEQSKKADSEFKYESEWWQEKYKQLINNSL